METTMALADVTSANTSSHDFHHDGSSRLWHTAELLDHVFVRVSLAMGIPGNILIFFVFTTFPKKTPPFLFQLLAIVDLLATIGLPTIRFLVWYQVVNVKGRHVGVAWDIYFNIIYFTAIYANVIFMAICLERMCSIRFPEILCTYFARVRVQLYSALIAILVGAFCIVVITKMNYFGVAWGIIFTILYAVWPWFTLFLLFCLILSFNLKQFRIRRQIEKDPHHHSHHNNHGNNHHNNHGNHGNSHHNNHGGHGTNGAHGKSLASHDKGQDRHPDGRHPDDRHPDDRHPDDRHPDDRHPDKSHGKAHDKDHDKSHGNNHDKEHSSHDKDHEKAHGKDHEKAHGKDHEKAHGKDHKTHEKSREKSHDRHETAHDKHDDKGDGKSHSTDHDTGQDKERRDKSADKHRDHSKDRRDNNKQDEGRTGEKHHHRHHHHHQQQDQLKLDGESKNDHHQHHHNRDKSPSSRDKSPQQQHHHPHHNNASSASLGKSASKTSCLSKSSSHASNKSSTNLASNDSASKFFFAVQAIESSAEEDFTSKQKCSPDGHSSDHHHHHQHHGKDASKSGDGKTNKVPQLPMSISEVSLDSADQEIVATATLGSHYNRMMYSVAIPFFVFSLPFCVIEFFYLKKDKDDIKPTDGLTYILLVTAMTISYMVHASKFYLYALSSGIFRQHLLTLVHCHRRQAGHEVVYAAHDTSNV